MEARSVDAIPRGAEWQYEPKWDGFRCLLSRNGDDVDLRSKSGEDLARYFPELVRAALALKATAFLLDGEIVVPHGKAFSFDDLLQRIHPAASRVKKLSEETPALFLAFDLLASAADSKLAALAAARAPPGAGGLCKGPVQVEPDVSAIAGHDELRDGAEMAAAVRRRLGRRDRQAPRPALSGRQPRRHAEDQEIPQRRLRDRRLPLRHQQNREPQGRGLAAARPL